MKVRSQLESYTDVGSNDIGSIKKQTILDQLSAMLEKEEQYICGDYSQWSGGADLIACCRTKMLEWILYVIDRTDLHHETAFVSMNYLDRFLCCATSHRATKAKSDVKEYQLAAMTCFYISVKVNEAVFMDDVTVSGLSKGLHTPQEITEMESGEHTLFSRTF